MKLHINQSRTLDELVNGCMKQNARAQKLVYERLSPRMYGVCLRYIKETTDAQDVLIKAFAKAFEQIRKYRREGSFEGWVHRIVVNEALMFLRKYKNMHVSVDMDEAANIGTPPSSALEADDLLGFIQRLPLGYRTVFNLYCVEGYSHAEIAEQLNISEGTSKSQLSRAKELLRTMITKHDRLCRDQLG